MDLVRWCIQKPVSVAVGVLLLVMFGLIGLGTIPIQLTPTVDRPIVTVTTNWPGRSPQEIIDSITREQEKKLKNVGNLKSMRSISREGACDITLEFYVGADIARALQEVSDALRQVPSYPDEVDEPTIKAAEGASENAIAWMIVDLDPAKAALHPDFDITTLFDPLDKEVRPYLERIDGVAEVNIYGGREREVRVLLDPTRMAQRSLNWLDVSAALRGENRNISAGSIAEGKRDYRVRVIGQFVTEEDVLSTIVAYRDGKPVYVRDIGQVEFGYQKQRGFVRSFGQPCIAINAIRQSNANVVEVMKELRERLQEVRGEILPRLAGPVGPDLRIRQVYDETTYIDSAINLVKTNLWQGGLLAALVLLLFLRSFTATGVIALAIPISVIGTFLALVAFGRTLNVISLAGLAFATGMVVDNAVVVLENTVRRLQLGDSPVQAAYRGGKEVWTALLASTLTTAAVFVPILTIQEEAGQLFRDISLAIACAVILSLVVSITVIPMLCARFLRLPDESIRHSALYRAWHSLLGVAPLCALLVRMLGRFIMWVSTGWRAWSVRPAVIALFVVASLLGSRYLAPPMDYLPPGNQNLVFGGLRIPPGYSLEQQTQIARTIEAKILPYALADINKPETVRNLPPILRFDDPTKPFDPVPVSNFFIGAFNGGLFVGATSQDPQRVLPIGNLLTVNMNTIPGAFGGAGQTSIFGRGIGSGNSVNVEISGPDLARVNRATDFVLAKARAQYGPFKAQPDPSNYNLSQPEWRVRVNARGRELGLSTRDVGTAVRGLFDGAFVDNFLLTGDTVDLVMLPAGGKLDYKEELTSIPIATPTGRVVPLDSVMDVVEGQSPQQIQRIEELPSVTVQVTPKEGETVEQVMTFVREQALEPARQQGLIDPTMRIRLEGTAAKLDEVQTALFGKHDPDKSLAGWQRAGLYLCAAIALLGAAAGALVCFRWLRGIGPRRQYAGLSNMSGAAYGLLGATLLGLVLAGLLGGFIWQPQLATARFIWALAVTYLLMCSLFESFLYPLVIMFSVPLAVVGGFAGLALVHRVSLLDPTKAPQQFDVITMLGFIILIGTVVNNAILLVEQALALMRPSEFEDRPPLDPLHAIAEAVRQRVRPIFMTTTTTLGGMLPLVIAPGAGSEMYRGLGAVVLGGLLVSTLFTLLLVPLVFGIVVQMVAAVRGALGLGMEELVVAADHAPRDSAARPLTPTPSLASNPSNGIHTRPSAPSPASPTADA
ncbi:MAG: efflux RND transporter permease subunit [Phycisphaerales bacterium]